MLGLALGGMFDGILLHQILQWHHLLSLVPGMTDLRTQVLYDGYLHASLYLLAAVALWGLWRERSAQEGQSSRSLPGALLIGFGMWHVVDAFASHWVLGIHRIRLDSPNPLLWDLLWLAAFGLVPLVLGWRLLTRWRKPVAPGVHASVALLLAGALTGAAAAWSLKPSPDQRYTTVVFAPGVTPAAVIDSVRATQAELAWTDASMSVIVVRVAPELAWTFYRNGALLVSGAGQPVGCGSWTQV